jgi:hypothetical protein
LPPGKGENREISPGEEESNSYRTLEGGDLNAVRLRELSGIGVRVRVVKQESLERK